MLWLKVGSHRFPLREGETTVGRSRYCTIVVDSPAASREHAAIQHTEGRLLLTDLNSRNGTLLNGNRVGQPTILQVGDKISIGSEELEVIETNNLPEDIVSTVERQLSHGTAPTDPPSTRNFERESTVPRSTDLGKTQKP